jgi:hypothetical protein
MTHVHWLKMNKELTRNELKVNYELVRSELKVN